SGEVPAGDAETTPGEAPAGVPTDAPAPEEIPAVPSAEALQIMQDSPIKITEILYDADGSDDGTEFLEISNLGTKTVDISGYMIGDEETRGGGEGMFAFPQGTKLAPGQSVTIAQSSLINKAKYRYTPDFELSPVEQYNPQDDPDVPNLLPTDWATGTIVMANGG
ncbi:lamin tail domain-containing protein, partial [Mesorhizobium sp. M00.F.Ca.ET.186.01.1.1]